MIGFFFQDVESLMEKHGILEKDFLKEREQEAISFQDRYKELQVGTRFKVQNTDLLMKRVL